MVSRTTTFSAAFGLFKKPNCALSPARVGRAGTALTLLLDKATALKRRCCGRALLATVSKTWHTRQTPLSRDKRRWWRRCEQWGCIKPLSAGRACTASVTIPLSYKTCRSRSNVKEPMRICDLLCCPEVQHKRALPILHSNQTSCARTSAVVTLCCLLLRRAPATANKPRCGAAPARKGHSWR